MKEGRWREGEEGEVMKQLREISIKLDMLTNTVFFISMAAKGKNGSQLGPSTESHENWEKCCVFSIQGPVLYEGGFMVYAFL